MSYMGERGFAFRSIAVLAIAAVSAGVVLTGGIGGATAARKDSPESRESRGSIRQMQRLSADEGGVLTDTALLFTRDAGASWTDITSDVRLDGVTDAFFLSAPRAWLAGVDSDSPDRLVVLHTSDGGASWSQQRVEASVLDSGQVYSRADVHFLDAEHGWLLGKVATSAAFSVGELLRTRDGGATWERLPRPPEAGRLVFIDAQRGFMTGAPVSERLYRTIDGGQSWQEVSLPVSAAPGMALYDLPTFHSPNRGAVAVTLRGDSPQLLTFVTLDGGRRWSPAVEQALPPEDYNEPVPVALSPSGHVQAFAAQGSVTLARDAVPRTFSLARQDGGGVGAVFVRALSLTEDGSAWVLTSEGGCKAGVCRQVTRLVAVDGSDQGAGGVTDMLVRTQEEVQPGAGSRS